MKKKVYYVISFIGVPLLLLLCIVFDNIGIIRISPCILSSLLILFSLVIGFCSATPKTFDYLVTAIVPLSLFCSMFIIGFLSKSDLETGFHIYKAIHVAFQPGALQLYVLVSIATFLASFQFFRNIKKRFSNH